MASRCSIRDSLVDARHSLVAQLRSFCSLHWQLSLSLSVSLCLSAVPRSVYSGLNNFSLVVLAYFSLVDKIQFVCQTDACVPVLGESDGDDDDELLFFTAQRLFSPSVSVLLFSGSSATSHSLPLGCRGWLLLSPFDASSCSCSSLSSAS